MLDVRRPLARLGHNFIDGLWRVGSMARFFALVIASSATSFVRFRLVMREVYFSGVLSLIIIIVSGLFIGMVLGLQGYQTLQKYGATESIGVLVALSLTRELGPVVSAILFAARAGSAITAEIGLMKTTEQLTAMDMMAVSPMARVIAPRFWAGIISMPILSLLFSAMGVFGGYIVGVVLIGVDNGAFWSQMQAAVEFRYDVLNGIVEGIRVRRRRHGDRHIRGVRCPANRGGRLGCDDPHRGYLGPHDPCPGPRAHRLHAAARRVTD